MKTVKTAKLENKLAEKIKAAKDKAVAKLGKKGGAVKLDVPPPGGWTEADKVVQSKGPHFLFEFPSIHGGKVHLVVGLDLADACERLSDARTKEDFKNKGQDPKGDIFRKMVCLRAGEYLGRALYIKTVGTPTNEPCGVVAINQVVAQAS